MKAYKRIIWYEKVISIFPANDWHYSRRKQQRVCLFLEEESVTCTRCFNLCTDGASAMFWSTPRFCVKGWEVNPQMKPFNCLLHTKNTAFNNLWVGWILWVLCILWILWCKSSSCEFDGSQLVTQQLCSAQLLYRLRSGAIMQRGQNLLCESKMSPQCTLTVALLHTHRSTSTGWNNNNNNNNYYYYYYLLQLGCHPVAVVILHVYKTWNWLLLNLSWEGYMRSM